MGARGKEVHECTNVTCTQWDGEWDLPILQTPDLGAGLGRPWAPSSVQPIRQPMGYSRTKVPGPLTGQFFTKHSKWGRHSSLGMDHLSHLAKNWAEPSKDTLSSLPASPTNWFTRSPGPEAWLDEL